MYRTASGRYITGEALVVFHVTGWQVVGVLAFKFGKQIGRIFTQSVDQYVQTTTMRHCNHDFLNTLRTTVLDQSIHCGNKTFTALK